MLCSLKGTILMMMNDWVDVCLVVGRKISIETLEGKILAIDASIWLTQFVMVRVGCIVIIMSLYRMGIGCS